MWLAAPALGVACGRTSLGEDLSSGSAAVTTTGATTSSGAGGTGGGAGFCGDGQVGDGEECDDGNVVDTDGCAGCQLVPGACGDGVVGEGEACDDGNVVDTDGCVGCQLAHCGDGFVQAGAEECDDGPLNADVPAFLLEQEGSAEAVVPIHRPGTATSFYAYSSESSHTGLEAVDAARLYLYRDEGTGAVSLFWHHGLDDDEASFDKGYKVNLTIDGFPRSAFIELADDANMEVSLDSGQLQASWWCIDNTDGVVISGLPVPGDWSLEIKPKFSNDNFYDLERWTYLDEDGSEIDLVMSQGARLTSFGASCRTDCTLPVCGDGELQAGELCDDGNTSSGDTCPASCLP